jgi:tetratricopeptide (TPR) repeat protein
MESGAIGRLAELVSSSPAVVDLADLDPSRAAAWRQRLEARGRVRVLLLQLQDAVARGDRQLAATLAQRLGQESSSSPGDLRSFIEPWLRRGRLALEEGRLPAAEVELLFASSLSPGDVEAALTLGEVYRRTGRWEAAAQAFRRVLDLEPSSLPGALGLADALRAQGRLADAAELLDAQEAVHPGDYTMLVNLGFFHQELARGDEDNVERHLSRARAVFLRAASLEPGRAEARAGLARLFWMAGDIPAAISEIDKALTVRPDPTYRAWRGLLLYESGRLEEARAELQRALVEDPRQLDALLALGGVLVDLGRPDQGAETWRRALELAPGNATAKENLRLLDESGLLRAGGTGVR